MNHRVVVWIAGTGWDAVPGTDKRLVKALPNGQQVLWVDPPVPITVRALLSRSHRNALRAPEHVYRNVRRIKVPVLPGVTRPAVRKLTSILLNRAIHRTLEINGMEPSAVVVAFPLAKFPPQLQGTKILYVTDDWLGGSSLMGFSRRSVMDALVSNLKNADRVAVISDHLVHSLPYQPDERNGRPAIEAMDVIPNGCPEPLFGPSLQPEFVAGLVGQLNERLDLDVLESVQATGVRMKIIGPRSDRNPVFRERLDRLLSAENVVWLGQLPAEDAAHEMARFGVGLTPYADTPFNRASFPLKTLEYLAAGVPVVSTDMPSTRWLNAPHVQIASGPGDFSQMVLTALQNSNGPDVINECRTFARRHTWSARALRFMELIIN